MKILSIDTSSNICGVSILENKNIIYNSDKNTDRTHSENLMPMIEEAFNLSNLTLSDIGLLVADIGPGSFTGLRIGIATIKAFRDSLNIPVVGISSLEVLAYNIKNLINDAEFIASIIDCKNNNCYFALYKKVNNSIEKIILPKASSVSDALKEINSVFSSKNNASKITFVGDASTIYKNDIISSLPFASFSDEKNNSVSSFSLGIAGLDLFNSSSKDSLTDILPLYLKKPQAQRLLEEKEKNLNQVSKN